MNILYVSAGLNGLDSLLFDGNEVETGLPSQMRILKRLIEEGHSVTLLFGMPKGKKLDIRAEWLMGAEAFFPVNYPRPLREGGVINLFEKMFFPCILRSRAYRLAKTGKFDFVYLHGESTASVARSARKCGIPCGHRAYGASIGGIKPQDRGKIISKLRHPYAYQVLTEPRDFVLATKDGSEFGKRALEVCRASLEYDLYEWGNGVDFPSDDVVARWDAESKGDEYLFCGARIDSLKNQEFAIETLVELKKLGHDTIKLVFAGGVFDRQYEQKLNSMIERLGLSDDVVFLGALPQSKMPRYHHDAIASFFTYRFYSRGNSFLEGVAAGCVPVALENDCSVRDIVEDNLSGFLVKSPKDAAVSIGAIAQNGQMRKRIQAECRRRAKSILKSWDDRAHDEIELIKAYACER